MLLKWGVLNYSTNYDPLKCSMSTDIINMLHATHQLNRWFHCHTVFEMGNIMLLFYLIHHLSLLLDTNFVPMDHCNYSWLEKSGFLLLDKCLRQLPPVLLKIWNSCKDCSTKRYLCWKLLGSCRIYRGCGAKCQNIYDIVSEWFIFWKQSFTLYPHPIAWFGIEISD